MMIYMARNGFTPGTGSELSGKTLAIHAYGNVGKLVARKGKAMGMRVIAYDPFVKDAQVFAADGAEKVDSIEDLYRQADYLSLHIPATDETKDSIGYDLLTSMPKGATLVNTARKEVIDEAGLLRALTDREDLKYITDIAPAIQSELDENSASGFRYGQENGRRNGRSQYQCGISCRKPDRRLRQRGRDSFSSKQIDESVMVRIKPFRGIRPPKEFASEVASRPYDVLNSVEAKAEATERSLLHIIKPEIDFEPIADEHASETYAKAVDNFRCWREKGWLRQDAEECYYIYAQTMDDRTQYGLTMCCHFEDYLSGAIKKHELTRPDKEEDRMIHVRNQQANIEPVFFAYPDNAEIDAIVASVVAKEAPEYDFTAADGFGHKLWVIRDRKINDRITELFATIPALYVADGHHRTAAAARVGAECKAKNPQHTGNEEYCYFLAVTFPASQLRIIDYNRVVRDLNGLTAEQFLEQLKEHFVVEEKGATEYRPLALHNFAMYFDGRWWSLTAKSGTYDDNDPIGVLDVTVLSEHVLDKVLGITDLRTSKRIDFVGGIRGLGELKQRVDSGEMQVAFALYPVSMQQLIDIADTGNIMPPKTTWFEPKLRSGVVIHSFAEQD